MKQALALLAISLACACAPTSSRSAPTAEASAFLGRLGTLLPDSNGGTSCGALAVRHGDDLVLLQEKSGGSAFVQGPFGRQRLSLVNGTGDGPGGYAQDQEFEGDKLKARLTLKAPTAQGKQMQGILAVTATDGLTAILPVRASISCNP